MCTILFLFVLLYEALWARSLFLWQLWTAFMWRKCGCNEGQQSRLSDYREHHDPGNVASSDSQLFNWCCVSPRLQPTVCLGALSGKTWEEKCWIQMGLSILQMSHISPLHLQTGSLTDSHPSLWCGVCCVAAKDYGDWIWVTIFKILPKGKILWNLKCFTNTDEQRGRKKMDVYIIIQTGYLLLCLLYSSMVLVSMEATKHYCKYLRRHKCRIYSAVLICRHSNPPMFHTAYGKKRKHVIFMTFLLYKNIYISLLFFPLYPAPTCPFLLIIQVDNVSNPWHVKLTTKPTYVIDKTRFEEVCWFSLVYAHIVHALPLKSSCC